MRFYNRQHHHYCGIDLHVKTMYICILDATGQVLVERVEGGVEGLVEAVTGEGLTFGIDDLLVGQVGQDGSGEAAAALGA